MFHRFARLGPAGLLLITAVAGCSSGSTPRPVTTVTVTVPPSSAPASRSSASASTSPSAAPGSGTGSPAPSLVHALPGTCASQLPLGSVIDAVGHLVPGRTAFVVGVADPGIGRLTYLNCRYGLATADGSPAIEIGVGLYRSPAAAAARIAPTVDDFTAHGATASETTVGSLPARLLLGGSGAGYGPTIALATGQRTVAITLRAGTGGATAHTELTRLAALAVRRTAPGAD